MPIIFTTGQYGPGLALIGVGFIGCNTGAAVVLLTLAVGLSGASYSGFQVFKIIILISVLWITDFKDN